MATPALQSWIPWLHGRDRDSLARAAQAAGFAEGVKSATNLILLDEQLLDPDLVVTLAGEALATADPDLALNNLERLFWDIPPDTLKRLLAADLPRRQLLTILGASPFLTGLLCRRSRQLAELFGPTGLAAARDEAEMLAELRGCIPDGSSFELLQQQLRQFKAREILRIGSRDLCGLASLEEVTAELSALAAATLQRACEVCEALLRREYGAPLLDETAGEPAAEAEFTVFGMGKFGGCELNFSSDIDLIYFYTSDRGQTGGIPGPDGEVRNRISLHRFFVKLSDLVTKAISQVTEDGFVFRVDLRLRPEGDSGEMANSLAAAEIYYESWGQSWERSAMLKARAVAGSLRLGERLLARLEPFIYRRHLDYAMVEDIKVMKQKIDRSLAREREGGQNLKLGKGGIREIEFFIQALQLIYAGKQPRLRERNSLKALELLCAEGLIKPAERDQLAAAYRFLRTVEHRIQVVQERQTHNLPTRPEELRALARRCGFADTASFSAALDRHRQHVTTTFRDLFYTSEEELPAQVSPEVAFLFDPAADPDLCKDILEEKGFRNPDAAYDSLLIIRDGGAGGHLTERARRLLDRIAPLMMQEVLRSPEPAMALNNLELFLAACRRARGTFYALLAENPEIIKLIVSLFATSQFLSRSFIQHPEVLDALVSRAHAAASRDAAAIGERLAALLAEARHYEEQLEVLRRFRNEEFLRIALDDLYGHTPQGGTTRQLSFLADACLTQALAVAGAELVPRFGRPCCRDADGREHEAAFAIIGMGKLGGMELNYHSDLDIIFVYEGDGETRPVEGTDPDRFRALSNQEYFVKLAQRIISVLTLITREGYVYQIDARLRPSGNKGPLVTSLPAYEAYHQGEAAPWERQALIKARVVTGTPVLAERIAALNMRIVFERPLPEHLAAEIYRLRQRMEKEIAREDEGHLNIKTGRGGMVDVEFLVQYLQLMHGGKHPRLRVPNTLEALHALHREGLLAGGDYDKLTNGYKFLRRLENKLRLVHDQSVSDLAADPASLAKLARHLGYPDRPRRPEQVFLDEYNQVTVAIREVFDRHLAPGGDEFTA
ncbi:MAG: bifunctional [glutamate--ammonia ligase]-adenylyl-L-tyrosine phosphorylase/[glutamate--ammonia-ligase] adenylyltransferase [Deltaproteobacteria bacterium]|nr:MAG: bifunctional [glutamate--ammonia ligase]-adenylyl-L-tyrosine phosphorylase/[glutamate--ammonia-ligase] adenylyltransferase [Deltaproteobacteria bacterium]